MDEADDAPIRIDLRTLDWAVQSQLSVPTQPAPIETWLPLLNALADHATQAAGQAAERAGKRVSCRKGCAACCRQLIVISLVEARALAKLVAEMPEPRQSDVRARFARSARRFVEIAARRRDAPGRRNAARSASIEADRRRLAAAWFAEQIACPLLEHELCGVHQARPLVCREYQVTSPSEACASLFREPVERVEVSAPIGPALARATATIAGVPEAMIPLVMALEWSDSIEAAVSGRHDAVWMLEILLGEIGDWRIDR
ncbi:MAG: YkgJ family cysteine cluster protein [Roseiarcus sp.]